MNNKQDFSKCNVGEEWREVPSLFGFYEVSNKGRVRRSLRKIVNKNGVVQTYKQTILLSKPSNAGYLCFTASVNDHKRTTYIHKIVAECFLENKKRLKCVHHINNIKTDNRAINLKNVTSSENAILSNKEVKKYFNFGEKSALSKLKESQVLQIISELKNYSRGDYLRLSKKYSLSPDNISLIHKGKTWRHIKR